jgi:hypothetical protein
MQHLIRHDLLLAIGFLMLLPGPSHAILAPESLLGETFSEQQRDALGTLALADAALRDAILEASLQPRIIERIAAIQERSSASFRAHLDQVPRSKQKDIWELVRHPELIDDLVLGGRPSRGSLAAILEPYPESVREIARRSVERDFDLLNDIAHLRSDAERETAGVLSSLPFDTQASFEALIERPDIMTTLASHPALIGRLGALYRESPQETRAILDRHHDELIEENDRAVAAWRELIEQDPEARDELVESAERFAEEEGYESPGAAATVVERTQVHHYYHPYPYWFGPPYWQVGLYWYPDRVHWGFSFDAGGAVWVFGLPSPLFSTWHFRYPHHYRHYPRLRHHLSQHGVDRHHRSRQLGHRQSHTSHRRGDFRGSHSRSEYRRRVFQRHTGRAGEPRVTHRLNRKGRRNSEAGQIHRRGDPRNHRPSADRPGPKRRNGSKHTRVARREQRPAERIETTTRTRHREPRPGIDAKPRKHLRKTQPRSMAERSPRTQLEKQSWKSPKRTQKRFARAATKSHNKNHRMKSNQKRSHGKNRGSGRLARR